MVLSSTVTTLHNRGILYSYFHIDAATNFTRDFFLKLPS